MSAETRPWGSYVVVEQDRGPQAVKLLFVDPGQRLSLQRHQRRSEVWMPLNEGGFALIDNELVELRPLVRYTVPVGTWHRLWSERESGQLEVLELLYGEYDENDITRLDDDYGRLGTDEQENKQ